MITLRLLQCGEYLELARGVQYNHRGPYRREAGGSDTERKRQYDEGSSKGVRLEDAMLLAVFEGRGRAHQPRDSGSCYTMDMYFSPVSSGGMQFC